MWYVRRNNKWFRNCFVIKKYLSNLGERGYVLQELLRKFVVWFERLNMIYKKVGFVSICYYEKKIVE